MKLLFSLLLSTILICVVWGWTALERTDNSVDHPGHCFSKNEKVGAMKKGEVRLMKGECMRVSCGSDTTIQFAGCGTVGGPPECKVTEEDLSKFYPDCCPGIVCP